MVAWIFQEMNHQQALLQEKAAQERYGKLVEKALKGGTFFSSPIQLLDKIGNDLKTHIDWNVETAEGVRALLKYCDKSQSLEGLHHVLNIAESMAQKNIGSASLSGDKRIFSVVHKYSRNTPEDEFKDFILKIGKERPEVREEAKAAFLNLGDIENRLTLQREDLFDLNENKTATDEDKKHAVDVIVADLKEHCVDHMTYGNPVWKNKLKNFVFPTIGRVGDENYQPVPAEMVPFFLPHMIEEIGIKSDELKALGNPAHFDFTEAEAALEAFDLKRIETNIFYTVTVGGEYPEFKEDVNAALKKQGCATFEEMQNFFNSIPQKDNNGQREMNF